jgi:TM2 domain-containing membrane protein YozV
MRSPLVAALLSALFWPGAGQFYNREFKKGFLMTSLTILLSVSLVIGLGRTLLQNLPQVTSPFDPQQMKVLRDAILQANPRLYGTYSLLLTATWIFSILDAFLGARERRGSGVSNPPQKD